MIKIGPNALINCNSSITNLTKNLTSVPRKTLSLGNKGFFGLSPFFTNQVLYQLSYTGLSILERFIYP